MKKLGAFLVGLGLSATCALAANTATSVNIVGFNNVTIPSNQYVMVGVNFDNIGGQSMTLVQMLGTNQLKSSIFPGQADKVILWDVVNQKYVIYGQKPDGNFYDIANWTGSPFTNSVPLAKGFWINSVVSSNRTFSLAGEVPSDLAITNYLVGSVSYPYQMIANPYPVDTALEALISTNNGAVASIFPGQADKVTLWDVPTQRYIVLGLKPVNKWYDISAWTGSPYTNNIGVGQAFWFSGKTNLTWIVQKNY